MRIGYACKVVGDPSLKMRSCMLRSATSTNLQEIIRHNLFVLDKIFDYNFSNNIFMFRISSDIIPFASHPINTLNWETLFNPQLEALGKKAKAYNLRLSMHVGQYTIINSPNELVVARAFDELSYHANFLDAMRLPPSNKIVIHVGGAYGNKKDAILRFCENFKKLPQNVKSRLVIENDEKIFNIEDCLAISSQIDIPIVFDCLHHELNPSMPDFSMGEIIKLCKKTWNAQDGTAKVHYSQALSGGRKGAHSQSIELSAFAEFLEKLPKDVDVMLEVKDKDLSAIKCIHQLNLMY